MRLITRTWILALAGVLAWSAAACSSDAKHGGNGGASPSSSSSASKAVTLPAVVVRNNGGATVFVKVTVKSKPYYFMLDSGASGTLLDSTVAQAIGLTRVGAGPTAKTLGCTTKTELVQVDDWSLGSVALPPSRLVAENAGFAKVKIKGVQVAGLLGADVQALTGLVKIDYMRETVTFGGPAPTRGKSIPIRVVKKVNMVVVFASVTLGGTKESMQIDTGASRSTLMSSLAKTLKLPSAGAAVTEKTVGCSVSTQPVTLNGARIGSTPVPTTDVLSTKQGSPWGPRIVGLFGGDLLSTFGTITIDYKGSKLTLGS
jgi:predicted aspartyl protease